jgi:hypothetical protein
MLQGQAFSIGIHPDEFGRLTMRQFYRCLAGAKMKKDRDRQLAAWHAWHVANFTNAKQLPDLGRILRKLEPMESRVMSDRAIRGTILGMAEAMGANIVRRKKGEAIQ